MKTWEPVDIIILIITGLATFVLAMASVRPLISETELSAEVAKILSTALGSLVSLISMYVGAKIQKGRKKQ